jgi:alpha-L-arabinofuranosidase
VKSLRAALVTVAISVISAATAAPSRITLTLSIDANDPRPQIDRNIYGQFAEHKGRLIYDGIWVGEDSPIPNTRGIRNDVVAALKRIHVPVVRWPGGCFGDLYHWRDGIGPREKRPRRRDVYGQVESNQFGTHEFMDFIQQIGSEPYLSVNVGSGSPQEASEWLEYMTATEGSLAELRRENGQIDPWKPKYVGIGNEMWGCGGFMRPEYYVDNLRRYSLFISNTSRFLIASGADGDDYSWSKTLMQSAAWYPPHAYTPIRPFQGISLHYYIFPEGGWEPDHGRAIEFSESEWFSTLRAALRMDRLLTEHSSVMDQYDAKKSVALVVDEWGTWYAPTSRTSSGLQQSSLRDALVAALIFNIFHRHTDRVKMANISMMVNVFQAMILTENEKMLLTPTYHVFDLYSPFQDAIPYSTKLSGLTFEVDKEPLSSVDVSAAKSKDGKLYLALVNMDPHRPAEIATTLYGTARGKIITAPHMDSHNTFEAPDSVRPTPYSGKTDGRGKIYFLLPEKSVAVVSIQE